MAAYGNKPSLLSAQERDVAVPLRMESCELATCFVGPCEVERAINPSAVCPKLLASLPLNPTFHVSQLKTVSSSDLSPPAKPVLCLCGKEWNFQM